MLEPIIEVVRLDPGVPLPSYAKAMDAGADVVVVDLQELVR